MSTSEPLNLYSAISLRKALDDRLRRTEDALDGFQQYRTLRRATTRFYDALDELKERVNAARVDRLLSEEGRQARIVPSVERFKSTATTEIEAANTAVEGLQARVTARTEPSPPTSDEALLESRLTAARELAYRTLDKASDLKVADEMRNLVTADLDPYITHLLLATSWPTLYLRSRGSNAATAIWEQYRRQLLPSVLDEEGTEAIALVHHVETVRAIPTILNGAYQVTLRDNDL